MRDDPVWSAFRARWNRLEPPLRPPIEVVARLAEAIAGHDEDVMLLGVTPELAGLGRNLTAIDWSADMIARVWPGDDARRWAVRADWRAMTFERPFDAVVGDGALNMLAWPDDVHAVLARLRDLLRPSGVVAVRAYVAPDAPEPLYAVRAAALAGGLGFHAFKWRLAMAAADGAANVALGDIHRAFEDLFPDRRMLAVASGWTVDAISEIDAYAGEAGTFAFPPRAQWRAAVPAGFGPAAFVEVGGYPLAERCPLLVLRRDA